MVFPMSVHHPVLPIGADLQLVGTDIVAILGFSGDGTLCGDGCEHSKELEVHLSRGKRDKRESGDHLRAQAGKLVSPSVSERLKGVNSVCLTPTVGAHFNRHKFPRLTSAGCLHIGSWDKNN